LGRGRARVGEVLGRPADVGAVLEGLLWHEGARRPHAELPPEPGEPEPDWTDLRDLLAFTIDPDEAKDFDDALSFRRDDRGIRAGVEQASDEVTEALRLAEQVSAELRRRRYARGALRIESGEIAFAFDGEGGVERAWIEAEPLAHSLVEEMMILANEAVAELL